MFRKPTQSKRISAISTFSLVASLATAGIATGFTTNASAGTIYSPGDTVLIERNGGYLLNGYDSRSLKVKYNRRGDSGNGSIGTGPFNFTIDGDALLTFCLEIDQTMSVSKNSGRTYTATNDYASFGLTNSEVLLMESLLEQHYNTAVTSLSSNPTTTDKKEAAAMQALLWELTTDDTFNLTSGDFELKSGSNSFTNDVLSLATSWYNTLSSTGFSSNLLHINFFTSANSQDIFQLVTLPQGPPELIPAPAAAGGGLILLGLASRRRRN